jgi:flagellar basal body rod protein FlgG
MNVSLYQAAAALNTTSKWQEVIAENMAASPLSGHKKQEVAFSSVFGGVFRPNAPTTITTPTIVPLPKAETVTNFAQGELKPTGVKTDLAIDGPGFFEIQLPNGSLAYTRSGDFKIDSKGMLVTKEGYLVMGEGGPIQINLTDPTPISVSETGEISQGANIIGKLNIVSFNNPSLLVHATDGYYLALNPALQQIQPNQSLVKQGFLETSNTSPVIEMTNLITAFRAFEANQKVITINDERMGKTIQELTSNT